MPSALVFLAEGAEEMETVITVDVLRRAGIDVTLAGLKGKDPVMCSRKVCIVPDAGVDEVASHKFDALVLPGGAGGAKLLAESKKVGNMLKEQEKRGAVVAAVCAAPTALAAHGIGKGKKATSYPGMGDKMEGYSYQEDRVVQDGKLITSRGPGTSFEFALKIVEELCGKAKADSLVSPMLIKIRERSPSPCSSHVSSIVSDTTACSSDSNTTVYSSNGNCTGNLYSFRSL